MIRLNNTPNEGSTVKVNLGFRDSAGQYYIPAKITYTLLALNNDKESWSVVDNLYEVPLTPASSVTLTIPDVKTITGTTLSRKIMVYWDAFVDNQYNSFTDEITFDIAPKPYVPNPPAPQPQPPLYVNINSALLQIGTLTATPIMPVFIFKTNLPVKIDNASANIKSGDLLFPCSISVDEGGGVLTVAAERELSYLTSYGLILEGLVSIINNYEMKEPFELSFVTMNESTPPYVPVIQDKKEVYINAEGEFIVSPDEGYDALHTVEVDVDLPIMDRKRITVTENGRTEIRPDANFMAMKRVVVDVDVPGAEFNYLTNVPCFKLADHDYPETYYKYLGVLEDGTLASTLEEFPDIQWLCVTYHGGSQDNIYSKNGVNLVSEDGTFDVSCTSVSNFNLVNGQWTDPWGNVYDVTVDTIPICQACYASGS